uniref:candidapepsin n=1 Tax=Metschnikowia reukaufii TaxID=27327 RepID=A8VYY1_9ASCO|nr:aspartic protease [Metschnikowia reukaufii]
MLIAPYIALLAAVVSAEKGHLKLDFESTKRASGLAKRQGLADLSIAQMSEYYLATLNIGSNNDTVKVLLDTGSSDLRMMQKDVECLESDESAGGNACSIDGTFDPKGSSTFKQMSNAPDFNITYGDGTFATGYYGIDSVSIGSARVPQCTFGVVNSTTSDVGVFGIGLPANEAGNADTPDFNGTGFIFPNFPLLLKSAGVTLKNVYSLYLNSEDATSGSVLFGAVDHAKYSGTLQTVPLVNPYPDYYPVATQFQIVISSVSVQGPKKSVVVTSSPFQALLDSGTTITQFPEDIVISIGAMMRGSYNETEGFIQVDCNYMTNTDSVIFDFSGAQISVPFSDLVFSDGSSCFLGLEPVDEDPVSDAPYAILGDNFLRHAYVVYDLEDYEISLAQVKYNATENIEVVTSTIPLAVQASGYSSTFLAAEILAIEQISTGIIQTGPAPSFMAHTSAVSGGLHTTAATTKASSSAASTSSASSTGTKLSSGIKSTCVTKIVLYSVVCAAFFAYF